MSDKRVRPEPDENRGQADRSGRSQKENPFAHADHRTRMRHDWQNLIEDLIEEGRQDGVFENLPGKGKPLALKRNTFAGNQELAFQLLKNNDLRPAWLEDRNRLIILIEELRATIVQNWIRHRQAWKYVVDTGQRDALKVSWDDACRDWTAEIDRLNKEIDDFNLKRPSDSLEVFKLSLDRELERASAPRWLR